MSLNHRHKVAIIGIGAVGSAVCYGLINQGICDDLVLVDVNMTKAVGEAMDLRHSIEYMGRNMKVRAGEYKDCGDADIAIICLGTPQNMLKRDAEGNVIRSSILEVACKMVRPAIENLMRSGFNGYIITITNPLDTITQLIWRLSGLPSNRVVGTGTALDTARLKCILGEIIDVDPHSINAYVIGEHGPTEFIPWSIASVGGKSMDTIKADNPDRFGDQDYDSILKKVQVAGPKVVNKKGFTNYGIASSAIAIARAILYDECRVIPVCTYLEGHYGVTNVFTSVPAIIGSEGVREIIDLHLTDEEMAQFMHSVETIREANRAAQAYL